MAKQTLAPSKTRLYQRYRDYIPYGARRAFLRDLKSVTNWPNTRADALWEAFHWAETVQGFTYWDAWHAYLEEAIRTGKRVKR